MMKLRCSGHVARNAQSGWKTSWNETFWRTGT